MRARTAAMAAPDGRGCSPPAPLPRGRLSAWLECVCAVTFDLELGQALERIYPPEGSLTEKERTSVCYLAFPDSYSGSLGDTQFSFRFRRSAGRRGAAEGERGGSREAPPGLQPEPAHLFGYVFFRQVRDRSAQRGYFQKSLVLVTRLPYVNLFHALLRLIAPEYFEKLDPCLEAVCSEIDQWPPPVPGQMLNLPVMGVVIQVRIPSRGDKPGSCPPAKPLIQENLLPAPLVLPSVAELDLFRCFQSVLVHVQLLWELVLLGEPLVVVAPSPTMSSEVVLALASCLAPLKYCCDFRPYFTIHDSEFKEYTTRTQGPPSVLLGVTNPFFIKMLQHWPHILRLGEPWMAGDLPKQVKLKKLAKLKTLDTKPGLYTSYRTFLHKDKTLIKRLLKGIQKKRPSEAQSALLRRQLLELTQSFIIPLTPPRIRPFHQEDFLKSLEHAGPQLTCVLKGDWLGLYRRFFKSPNFDGWFRQRHREMRHKLEALHLEAIAEANVGAWMVDKSEAEAVDLVLKLREKLGACSLVGSPVQVQARSRGLPAREETLQRVCQHITVVVRSLPKDLQAILCHQETAAGS
ncbi:protein DENND6B isoform 2-T2 [Vipera latastei]